MSKKDPTRFKKGREFIGYAVNDGNCTLRRGRHPYVTAPNGQGCPIPDHPGDLDLNVKRSILRSFIRMEIWVPLLVVTTAAGLLMARSWGLV